ncbi:hypothetical protein [Desulfobacula sp.]
MLRSILLYTLFFTAAVIIFIFLLFPGTKIAQHLSSALKNQNWNLSIDNVKLALPFKLKFENTKFSIGQNINQVTKITPQSFEIILDPISIFKDKKQMKIQSYFDHGSIKGQIELVFPVQKSSLDLTCIILPESPYIKKLANMADIKSTTDNIQKNGLTFTIKGSLENSTIGI